MAKPNQGIQIALILFVLISVILGVTTYLAKKEVDEIIGSLDVAIKKEAAARISITELKGEIAVLKEFIGYPDVSIARVKEGFDGTIKDVREDMKLLGVKAMEDYLGQELTCTGVLDKFQETEKLYHKEISDRKKDIEKQWGDYRVREGRKEGDIAKAAETFRKANEQKMASDKKHKETLASRDASLTETFKKLDSSIGTLTRDVGKVTAQIEKVQAVTDEKEEKITYLKNAYEKTLRPPHDDPQGEIIYVNPNGGLGLINLGKADNVTRGLSFTVYDPTDMSEQGKKGIAEVLDVTEDRRAEIRILNDSSDNPIREGDVLYTATWTAGVKEHYALMGVMDIEGDGGNELETVRLLVMRNGGVIDASLEADGSVKGKITQETNFIIEGKSPENLENASELAQNSYASMKSAAKRFGTRTIPLHEYLRKVSYRPPSELREKTFVSGAENEKKEPKKTERKPGAKKSAY